MHFRAKKHLVTQPLPYFQTIPSIITRILNQRINLTFTLFDVSMMM